MTLTFPDLVSFILSIIVCPFKEMLDMFGFSSNGTHLSTPFNQYPRDILRPTVCSSHSVYQAYYLATSATTAAASVAILAKTATTNGIQKVVAPTTVYKYTFNLASPYVSVIIKANQVFYKGSFLFSLTRIMLGNYFILNLNTKLDFTRLQKISVRKMIFEKQQHGFNYI